jgi:Domain of unknown function (DUF4411)
VAYSIDSSGVLDLFRYYPPDVFPTIWTQMEAAARGGVIFAIDEVYRELEKKDDVAFEWLKARRTIVVDIDTQIQQRVTAILAVHPRLIDTRKNRSSGDPFVIALAQSRGFSVVTGEKASGIIAKPNIPDVCEALRIPWMNVLSMFRNEGWRA